MTDVSQADLTAYYDLLHLWTRFNKGFRAFSGVEAHAIHRWLDAPDTGEFSPATVHRLMLATGIGANEPVEALDAGCGYGGTMFALREAIGGRWHGVTLSRRQCAVGRRAARDKGVRDAITFARGSYDDPLPQRYNLIYAIESLIHSADPARSIANLARALRPGGTFIIVDDMPADEISAEFAGDLARFKNLWRCPVMPSARQWAAHLSAAGCDIVEIRDLSHLMRPRSERETAQAIEEVAARRRWRDRLGLRRVGEAETGGLLLERLGRERMVSYVMIVVRMHSFRA
ncbi:MAG: SAM-dependent methyltransferase [Xanthobacteraceae bacterium]